MTMLALSWSRLNTYMQCPRKFHLEYITKSFPKEEKSIHLVKGEQLHKQLEDYVLAKNGHATMPLGFSPEVRNALPYVDRLYTLYQGVYPEAQVATRVDWTPTEWFAKDTAWRAIWDAVCLSPNTAFIVDWKSGKINPYGEGFGQLHLSALIALERFKDVAEVNAAYVYIEHQKVTPIKVVREAGQVTAEGKPIPHVAQLRTYFDQKFETVQLEKAWEPIPNEFCKWCPATKAMCKFSRKL